MDVCDTFFPDLAVQQLRRIVEMKEVFVVLRGPRV